jgi:DivIVA domain-containing protein
LPLGLVWVISSLTLLGHRGPGWVSWLGLPLACVVLAMLVIPGIVFRRRARLPWWRFWTDGSSPAASSADLGDSEPVIVPDAAALIERIRTVTFGTTRLQPGYDEEEVDKFLDKLIADLGDDGRLHPDAVRDVTFSTTRLRPGYTEQEVDDFLDEVISWAVG